MLDSLRKLELKKAYSLEVVYDRLITTNQFSGDLATLITMLWNNKNFSLSLPHNQPPNTFTIKRINDYE